MSAAEEKEKQNTSKLEALRTIEKDVEAQWEREKTFEVNAPPTPVEHKRKYFVTFPYAYMKFDTLLL